MDNLGFQHDVEEVAFSMSENSNNIDYTRRNSCGSPHLLSGCSHNTSESSSGHKSKLSASSSFNLPKNKALNKYRRFSESFSSACKVPQRVNNDPSSEASEKIKCDIIKSSFITLDNKSTCDSNFSTHISSGSKNYQRRSSDDDSYIGIGRITSTNKRRQLPLDEFQQNNLNICSSQMNFHDSVLNNVQESISVPSVCVNNSLMNSMPSNSSTLNKNNLISDSAIDILKTFNTTPISIKSKIKYANSPPTHSYINNKNHCSENTSPFLGNHRKIVDDDSVLVSFSQMIKSQNNVNKALNRAKTLPTVIAKNQEYFSNQSSEIRTVSGTVPMFYPGYQQASPRPCAENRQNLRRSSKILRDSCQIAGDRTATLKRRSILRGWKLQFIPSDHSKRRAVALCCVLLLACALLLAAIGLIVYVTTAMKSTSVKLGTSCEDIVSGVNVVAGEFRIINEKYEPTLKDEKSADFKQLADQITQQLDILFSASSLSLHYNHSQVSQLSHGFGKTGSGGIQVRCKLVLTSVPPHGEAANLAGLEFLRGLRHHQGQMWLGNFVIDVQSIGFVAVVDTESTPTELPDPALIPGWSVWSSWSQCTSNTQMRTRLCRLNMGSGAELTSTEPCLLLEHPGGDLEVRDCQHNDSVVSSRMLEEVDTTSAVTMQSTILKRTTDKIRHTTDINTNRNNPTIPVMDLTLSPYRHCDECVVGEVCVALIGEEVPTCRKSKDSNDPTGCGGLCLINMELCDKLDVDAFRCLHDTVCLPNEWRCTNQLCIPELKRCDGHLNCYDHTDEYNCECNLLTHFRCGSNTSCLPLHKKCDGIIDCWDGSDELNCTIACPSGDEFTCNDGQCIPHAQFCDGFADCVDSSDEPFGCGGECKNHEWKCGNGRCIKKKNVCDGSDNCGDNADEINCPPSRMQH